MKKIKENLSRMLIVVCGFLLTIITKVKADSGFDGSYDSGGGSFDFDYDYDYDNDYDYDYSSGGSSGSMGEVDVTTVMYIIFSMFYVIFCYIAYAILFSDKKKTKKVQREKRIFFIVTILINNILVNSFFGEEYPIINSMNTGAALGILIVALLSTITIRKSDNVGLTEEKVHKKLGLDFNMTNFYNEVFNTYKDIQIAWMDNRLEDVRDVLSDEIFNMYKMQLMTLTTKNQKNMMEEITFEKAYILGIRKHENKEEIDVCLVVTCRDYIIDVTTNKVLRGDKNVITKYKYKLTFVRTNNVNKERKCPSCRADLGDQVSTKCPNCGNIVVDESSKFIMTNKKIITQSNRRG